MIRELDLGDVVLQWRDDGRWRAVDKQLLAAERRGEETLTGDSWVLVRPGHAYTAGLTHVYGQVVDGVPDRITVGREDAEVRVLEGVWGARWNGENQRVVIFVKGRETAVFDFGRRRGYLAPEPDEPLLHDQPAMGWVRPSARGAEG